MNSKKQKLTTVHYKSVSKISKNALFNFVKKILKTLFKDSGWLKRSTQWTNVLVGFGGPDH